MNKYQANKKLNNGIKSPSNLPAGRQAPPEGEDLCSLPSGEGWGGDFVERCKDLFR